MVPLFGGNVSEYPASNVSGAFKLTPSAPEPESSFSVNVFAFSIATSSFILMPLSVIDILLSALTTAVIAADVLSPRSSTLSSVLPSKTLFVMSCTVLSSRSK